VRGVKFLEIDFNISYVVPIGSGVGSQHGVGVEFSLSLNTGIHGSHNHATESR